MIPDMLGSSYIDDETAGIIVAFERFFDFLL